MKLMPVLAVLVLVAATLAARAADTPGSNPAVGAAAALRLDPRHKGAHEYLGEAWLMDGKPAEAEKHLAELEKICGGKACEEYQDLAKAIADHKAKR